MTEVTVKEWACEIEITFNQFGIEAEMKVPKKKGTKL